MTRASATERRSHSACGIGLEDDVILGPEGVCLLVFLFGIIVTLVLVSSSCFCARLQQRCVKESATRWSSIDFDFDIISSRLLLL